MTPLSRRVARRLLGAAALSAGVRTIATAQDSSATVHLTVRSADGEAAPDAFIVSPELRRAAYTDSAGVFALRDVRPGLVRLQIISLKFEKLDTVVRVLPGADLLLQVVLRDTPESIELRVRDSVDKTERARAGVDSSALGLLNAHDTHAGQPYEINAFGSRLLSAAAHARDAGSNTVLSPLSVGLTLSLLSLGARGATSEELSTALGEDRARREQLSQGASALTAAIRGRDDVQLELASAVWIDSSARFTTPFADHAKKWGVALRTVPLASQAADTAINHWAASATHGKIAAAASQPLPAATKLLVTDVVYFAGQWITRFEKALTRGREFTLSDGRRISVISMQRMASFGYRREPGYQMVRLPYIGGRMAMYVILPDSGVTRLEETFAEHGWPVSLTQKDKVIVDVWLPKLRLEQSLDVLPFLRIIGVQRVADCERADFSGLASARRTGGALHLCIGEVVQHVHLEIDEGTEGANITRSDLDAMRSRPLRRFIVDRPYLVMLRDELTGVNLFVGRIEHP